MKKCKSPERKNDSNELVHHLSPKKFFELLYNRPNFFLGHVAPMERVRGAIEGIFSGENCGGKPDFSTLSDEPVDPNKLIRAYQMMRQLLGVVIVDKNRAMEIAQKVREYVGNL